MRALSLGQGGKGGRLPAGGTELRRTEGEVGSCFFLGQDIRQSCSRSRPKKLSNSIADVPAEELHIFEVDEFSAA